MENPIAAIKSLLGIEQTLSSLRAEFDSKRSALATAKERKQFLESAPRCREDAIAALHSFIDASADFYSNGAHYVQSEFAPLKPSPPMIAQRAALIAAPSAGGGGSPAQMAVLQGLLCFAMNDELKAATRRLCETWDFSNAGPPMAARATELEKLKGVIFKLETELNEMSNKAAQMGITV
ncbi:MAG: hypothetical protein IT492_19345 [Gammaproteobacteria bacterium]|nr:hypothetical protein [Gammaproteobacteria bacterium]